MNNKRKKKALVKEGRGWHTIKRGGQGTNINLITEATRESREQYHILRSGMPGPR
jgi:hypothetical protein